MPKISICIFLFRVLRFRVLTALHEVQSLFVLEFPRAKFALACFMNPILIGSDVMLTLHNQNAPRSTRSTKIALTRTYSYTLERNVPIHAIVDT